MARGYTEKTVKRRRFRDVRGIGFMDDVVRLPNGKRAQRAYFDHPGAAGVLAFRDPRTVVLVRQYRYPVSRHTLEIPAGKFDRKGAGPLATIRRELREETGFRARRWKKLLPYWPTPAFSNEVLHLYEASGLEPGKRRLDDDEFLDVVEMPYQKLLGLVLNGRILDSKTVIAVLSREATRRRR